MRFKYRLQDISRFLDLNELTNRMEYINQHVTTTLVT